MTITELVEMARRMHDAERVNLGADSTREQQNAFWMFVVGCAHYGHPVYNPSPDPRRHVKDGGGGRPMSNDVVALLPSREAWDCIPGAGAGRYDPENRNGGYRFEAHAIGALPAVQTIYPPNRPPGPGVGTTPKPPKPVEPPKPAASYPDENTFWKAFQEGMRKAYSDAGRAFPDPNDADAFRRFSRCGFDIGAGLDPQKASDKHIGELRAELGV